MKLKILHGICQFIQVISILAFENQFMPMFQQGFHFPYSHSNCFVQTSFYFVDNLSSCCFVASQVWISYAQFEANSNDPDSVSFARCEVFVNLSNNMKNLPHFL